MLRIVALNEDVTSEDEVDEIAVTKEA